MNYRARIISISVIVIIVVLIIFSSRNKLFIPENKVANTTRLEVSKPDELTSCQMDCTLNDGVFHEECIGYNGCVDSLFIKDKGYCEDDSDCVIDLGCCYDTCQGGECINIDYCGVSNKQFVLAHGFSCKNNIICKERKKCRSFSDVSCLNNVCRIVS